MPDDPKNIAERNEIQKLKQRVRRHRSRCKKARNLGRPIPKAPFRDAVIDYKDALVEHKSKVSDLWEEHNLDRLGELEQEMVEVEVGKPGYGGHTTTKTKPKITTVDVQVLIDFSKALDEVVNKLGLGASTKRQVHNDEAGMDDLRGLLQYRGQEDALENLPEGDD